MQAFDLLLAAITAGQHDDVDITVEILFANGAAEFEAVHLGHFPIGDDQMDGVLAQA